MIATAASPCIVYPVGHDRVGECLAPMDGAAVFAASAEQAGPAAGPLAPIPPDVSPDTHPLCLIQRVAYEPGSPALYRNWCTPDAPPAPLPDTPNQLLAARRLMNLGPDTCPRGTEVSLDHGSGRLRCVAPLADPCRAALVPAFGDEGAMIGYTCAPAAGPATTMLPSPCPAGTWLLPRGGTEPGTFVCRNPCPEGQEPHADGSGAYVCMAVSQR
jgi:hypothetical protein